MLLLRQGLFPVFQKRGITFPTLAPKGKELQKCIFAERWKNKFPLHNNILPGIYLCAKITNLKYYFSDFLTLTVHKKLTVRIKGFHEKK